MTKEFDEEEQQELEDFVENKIDEEKEDE